MKIKILLAAILIAMSGSVTSQAKTPPPNIVVIVVDDQRWNEYGAAGHPWLETPNIDLLAAEGATFTSAYAVSPLCSPSRASILTGQYISRHGIVDNLSRTSSSHRLQLFPQALQKAGYETAHVGKWHMGNDPSRRPGYDYWVSYPGQGRSTNPILHENGRNAEVRGYLTDVLTDRAVSFIEKERQRPFFLYIGHKALHPEVKQLDDASIDFDYGSKYKAAPRHVGMYKDAVYPRRANAIKVSQSLQGKPVIAEALQRKRADAVVEQWQSILDFGTSQDTIRDRSEMLLAVDDSLGRIMQVLDKQGIADNTVLLLTSDNGYFYGEHGLSIERRMPYEEGVRVPLLLRYPDLVKGAKTFDQFALSIDIAPTLLKLAGEEPGPHIQGESLLPLLTDSSARWRDSFLIEYVSYENPFVWLSDTSYKVVRKGPFKYVHWVHHEGKDELYDLSQDPYELNNIINSPDQSDNVIELKDELGRLIVEASGL